jgi:phosphate starvation-inducible PhoH-like protein
MESIYSLSELNSDDLKNVFGQFDCHIKKIEKELNVDIVDRNGNLKITGEEQNVLHAVRMIDDLIKLS